jgi:hypothetical protein
MIGATFGSALFCMLLSLLFFSTPSLRRHPLFICNALILTLGICNAAINIYEEVGLASRLHSTPLLTSDSKFHTLLTPAVPISPHVIIAIGTLDAFDPIIVDCVLLLRLVAVYPPSRTPFRKVALVLGLPIAIKIGRVVNSAIFMAYYAKVVSTETGVGGAAILVTSGKPNVKVEWALQVLDNLYVR